MKSKNNLIKDENIEKEDDILEWKRNLKCDLCQKTNKDMYNFKNEWIENIEKELKTIKEKKIKIKEINGFTVEKITFLEKINKNLKEMDIEIFVEQKKNLLLEEPRLQILYNYLKKYNPSINDPLIIPFKGNKPIKMKKVGELQRAYISQSEKIKEVNELNIRVKMLTKFKNYLKDFNVGVNIFFRSDLLVGMINNKYGENFKEYDLCTDRINEGRGILLCNFCLEIIKIAAEFDITVSELE